MWLRDGFNPRQKPNTERNLLEQYEDIRQEHRDNQGMEGMDLVDEFHRNIEQGYYKSNQHKYSKTFKADLAPYIDKEAEARMYKRTKEDNDLAKEKLRKTLNQCEQELKSLEKVQKLIETIKQDIETELKELEK